MVKYIQRTIVVGQKKAKNIIHLRKGRAKRRKEEIEEREEDEDNEEDDD